MKPIVLTHGFFGFSEMAGIRYFKGIKAHLTREFPGLKVIEVEVAPNDLIEQRARQIREQLEPILGSETFHIIGHSMGGLDARYLLSPRGLDKSRQVVSLTTVSTPHWGSPVADFIIKKHKKLEVPDLTKRLDKSPAVRRRIEKIIKKLESKGELWRYLLEFRHFTTKGMTNLTTAFLKEFNRDIPDAPGVRYFSYAGASGPGEKDPLPAALLLPWLIVFLNRDEKGGGRSDSFVSVESARWGNFLGEIPADHFMEVGHDLSSWGWVRRLLPWKSRFNHLKFFEEIVRRLHRETGGD